MKDLISRLEKLEKLAGIEESRSIPPRGDFDDAFAYFEQFLKEYGQHDKRSLQHFFVEDGSIRFLWASSQVKWNAFYYAWDLQRQRCEKQNIKKLAHT